MLKMILGGLILILVTACAPVQIPIPPVEIKTAEPKFWQGFPIMPGGVEVKDDIAAYHFTVNTDIDSVIKFYRKQMKNTEWNLIGTGDMSGADMKAAVMWFANTKSTVQLDVWIKDDLTNVAFNLDSRYPTHSP